MGSLYGVRIEFDPAGVWQFDEAAGRVGEAFQVRLAQLHAFRFPFGRNGEPINAAAFDDQFRLEPARMEEQTMERGVAEKFHAFRAALPGNSERAETVLIRVADPKTGFGR